MVLRVTFPQSQCHCFLASFLVRRTIPHRLFVADSAHLPAHCFGIAPLTWVPIFFGPLWLRFLFLVHWKAVPAPPVPHRRNRSPSFFSYLSVSQTLLVPLHVQISTGPLLSRGLLGCWSRKFQPHFCALDGTNIKNAKACSGWFMPIRCIVAGKIRIPATNRPPKIATLAIFWVNQRSTPYLEYRKVNPVLANGSFTSPLHRLCTVERWKKFASAASFPDLYTSNTLPSRSIFSTGLLPGPPLLLVASAAETNSRFLAEQSMLCPFFLM